MDLKIAIKRRAYIPFLTGRPKRDDIIQVDEMTNLAILLNTEKDFYEFLDKI